jgi:hypothetical protein
MASPLITSVTTALALARLPEHASQATPGPVHHAFALLLHLADPTTGNLVCQLGERHFLTALATPADQQAAAGHR